MKVLVIEENSIGEVVSSLAHGALIRYSAGGIEYEIWLSNDEFYFLDDEVD